MKSGQNPLILIIQTKKTGFTESHIVMALKEHEGGKKAEAICSELGISRATFYNCKKRYWAWTVISSN